MPGQIINLFEDRSNKPSAFADNNTHKVLTNKELEDRLKEWGITKHDFYRDVYSKDSATRNNMLDDAHVVHIIH